MRSKCKVLRCGRHSLFCRFGCSGVSGRSMTSTITTVFRGLTNKGGRHFKTAILNAYCSQKRFLPICTVTTNLKDDDIPEKFGEELVDLVANVLSKPRNLVSVSVETNNKMWRGDSNKPTATVNIWSIGVFDPEKNKVYTPKFFEFFIKNLKLPNDRIALIYHPIGAEQAGHLIYQGLNESKGK